MKRYGFVVVLAVLIMIASGAFANNSHRTAPFPGQYGVLGNGTIDLDLQRGLWKNTSAWYASFATNNIKIARSTHSTFVPILLSAANTIAAPTVYMVTNFNQPLLFSTSPIDPEGDYTGLWTITFITWNPGVARSTISDASNLPAGITLTPTNIVVDSPIFAVGTFSNPWILPVSTTPPYMYRIPQGIVADIHEKELVIPYWTVYGQDPVTRRIYMTQVLIPDSSNAYIAALIGANYAPNLAQLDLANRSTMFVFNWHQTAPFNVPLLPCQYPVISDIPKEMRYMNTNFAYSPIDSFVLLDRNPALLPPWVLFRTTSSVITAIESGGFVPIFPFVYPPVVPSPVVNAPVLLSPI